MHIDRTKVIDRPDPAITRYQQPHAINWRWQTPGSAYGECPNAPVYQTPHAINWRWQM